MATIDLTDKLGISEKPTIKIGKETLTVNNSATTMLQIMATLGGDNVEAKDLIAAIDLLFDEKSRKAIEKLNLSFNDLTTLIQTASSLVVGEAGEAATLDTTS